MKRLDYSKEIELIKQHGGHLYFGRCSWSLHIYEHKAWPNDPTSTSTKTTTLSGYYNINDTHEILELCLQNNIPVIDTRHTSISQAFETIKMPLISTRKGYIKMENKFIIEDWAGNILDFKGTFKLPQLAAPMKFETFEDAWGYIDSNIDEDCHDDVFVIEIARGE